MKFYYSLLFLLSLMIASCTLPQQTESVQVEETVEVIESASTALEALASPQAVVVVESATPLPSEASAPLIDAPSIINIEMLDERNGWGVTEKEIVRTDDGGVTWYNVTPQGLTETGFSVIPEFLDEKNAWLQIADPNNYPHGGTIYKTVDGGISWDSFSTPFSTGDLEFIDDKNGWILADLGVGAGSMAISVFQTFDGGETWERKYTNDPNLDGASETLPLGGIKVFITPLDMQTAWIGGVVYSNGSVYLFRSDDGGETWFNINLVLPQDAIEKQITVEKLHFVSSTNGVLALRMSSNVQETLIFTTTDAGNTWQAVPEIISESGLFEAPSAKEFILYSSSQFFITKDAGATFEIINPNIAFDESLTDISFVNANFGWAVSTSPTNQRVLYRTDDGGNTWFPLNP